MKSSIGKPLEVLLLSAVLVTSTIIAAYASTIDWRFTDDVLVSSSDLGSAKEEAAILRAPNSINKLISAYIDSAGASGVNCRISNSTDGGASWIVKTFLSLPTGTNVGADPSIAVNGNTWYVGCLAQFDANYTQNDKASIFYSTSTNNGNSWGAANVMSTHTCSSSSNCVYDDKPWIAVKGTDVYMCWARYDNKISLDQGSSSVGNHIIFRKVGATEHTPLGNGTSTKANHGASDRSVQGCTIITNPLVNGANGIIYILWSHLTSDTAGAIEMRRSFDNGVNFDAVQTVATFTRIPTTSGTCVDPFGCVKGELKATQTGFRVPNFPQVAIDSSNNLHIVYEDWSSQSLTDIKYKRITSCTTQGQTCTLGSAVNVLNDGNIAVDQFLPALVLSEKSNAIHITSLDRRNDATNNIKWQPMHYHCHLSNNNCDSSTNWSTSTISPNQSSNVDGSDFIGDYYSVTSNSAREAYAVWVDTRATGNSGQLYRIWSDRTTGGVNIYAEDCSGSYINGMSVGLYDSTGNTLLKSGFTPMYVAINQTNPYVVKFNNFGNTTFVSAVPMPSPVTSYTQYGWGGYVNTQLDETKQPSVTGKYNTAGGTSCSTTGTIKVSAIKNGAPLTGMFVQIKDGGGTEIGNGYTPITFTESAGTYTVYPNDFGSNIFDHWDDNGSTTRGRTVTLAANQEWELMAVYR